MDLSGRESEQEPYDYMSFAVSVENRFNGFQRGTYLCPLLNNITSGVNNE